MANPANLNAATSLEQQLYLCALNLQMKELALPADTRENGKATYAVITYLDD